VTFGGAHQGTIDNAAAASGGGLVVRWPPSPPPLLRKIYVWVLARGAVLNERFNHACATAKEKALCTVHRVTSLDVTQLSVSQVASKPLSKPKSRIELLFN
jgi:hypothetical protein